MSGIQIFPLPKVHGRWRTGEKYPYAVDVLMADGRVFRYEMVIRQPRPQLLDEMESIKNTQGYQRRGKHERISGKTDD